MGKGKNNQKTKTKNNQKTKTKNNQKTKTKNNQKTKNNKIINIIYKKISRKIKEIKGRKGMAVGMVFIFIVAAVTFALIMIFGYKAIADFMAKGEQVEFYQFKSYLETSIKKIYTEYGSVRLESFSLPMKYERICFVDLEAPFDEGFCEVDPIACELWRDAGESYQGADENVFLKPAGLETIKVYRIKLSTEDNEGRNYLCLPVDKGNFRVRLEGLGDKTLLSPAPRG